MRIDAEINFHTKMEKYYTGKLNKVKSSKSGASEKYNLIKYYGNKINEAQTKIKNLQNEKKDCSLDTCYLSINYQQSEHKTTLTKSQINTVSSFIKEHKFELEIDANKKIDPTYVPLQYYYTSTKKEKIIILKPMFK